MHFAIGNSAAHNLNFNRKRLRRTRQRAGRDGQRQRLGPVHDSAGTGSHLRK
jgi:hypothetical protein